MAARKNSVMNMHEKDTKQPAVSKYFAINLISYIPKFRKLETFEELTFKIYISSYI